MHRAGAEEFLPPALHPAELWRSSGRWDAIDQTMFRLQDRRGGDYCLAMTHEEVFAAIARADLHSYRQLPQRWFQIGPKLGGRESVEFVLETQVGEDVAVRCSACGYTANLEVARSRVTPVVDEPAGDSAPVAFATPGVLTIDALAAPPHSVAPWRQLKTLVYIADQRPVVAVVRGDDTLNEAKLQIASEAFTVRAAQAAEIFALTGAYPGSLGAVGFDAPQVLVDASLAGRTNMVTGANRDGFHLRGVDLARGSAQGTPGGLANGAWWRRLS